MTVYAVRQRRFRPTAGPRGRWAWKASPRPSSLRYAARLCKRASAPPRSQNFSVPLTRWLNCLISGLLHVRVAVLLLEPLDPAGRIHESLLAGVERVAHRAGFRVDLLGRAPRLERVAAAAVNHDLVVSRMDLVLHGYDSQTFPKPCILPKRASFSTEFSCDFEVACDSAVHSPGFSPLVPHCASASQKRLKLSLGVHDRSCEGVLGVRPVDSPTTERTRFVSSVWSSAFTRFWAA